MYILQFEATKDTGTKVVHLFRSDFTFSYFNCVSLCLTVSLSVIPQPQEVRLIRTLRRPRTKKKPINWEEVSGGRSTVTEFRKHTGPVERKKREPG